MKKYNKTMELLDLSRFPIMNSTIKNNVSHFKKSSFYCKCKCKVNNIKYKLTLHDKYLIIENSIGKKTLSCKKLKNIRLLEKMWCYRVQFTYEHKKYQLDFPSFKKASEFMEKLIYCKVKAKLD